MQWTQEVVHLGQTEPAEPSPVSLDEPIGSKQEKSKDKMRGPGIPRARGPRGSGVSSRDPRPTRRGNATRFSRRYTPSGSVSDTMRVVWGRQRSKGDIPRRKALIEGGCTIEHAAHVGYLGDIPRRQALIEGGRTTEHTGHVGYLGDIPRRQVLVEGGRTMEH